MLVARFGGDCAVQNTNNTDYFSFVVKAARKKKDLTQSRLAEKLSISTRYLKAIENSGQKQDVCCLTESMSQSLMWIYGKRRKTNGKHKDRSMSTSIRARTQKFIFCQV